jgi:hypothetical protein
VEADRYSRHRLAIARQIAPEMLAPNRRNRGPSAILLRRMLLLRLDHYRIHHHRVRPGLFQRTPRQILVFRSGAEQILEGKRSAPAVKSRHSMALAPLHLRSLTEAIVRRLSKYYQLSFVRRRCSLMIGSPVIGCPFKSRASALAQAAA